MSKTNRLMKLYEVPKNTMVRHPNINNGEPFKFHHVDGMYSYCTLKDNSILHLAAWEDVEVVDSE